jgi:hypothetical protein
MKMDEIMKFLLSRLLISMFQGMFHGLPKEKVGLEWTQEVWSICKLEWTNFDYILKSIIGFFTM